MNWKERIIVDPEVLAGKPTIKGTRISVEFVVDLLGRGATVTDILEEYDHITAEDIQACLAYAGGTPLSDLPSRMPRYRENRDATAVTSQFPERPSKTVLLEVF